MLDTSTRRGGDVALAIQGGGTLGAFAWGVLDGLLEAGVRPDRVCGVSSGALCAVALAQGFVHGGSAGARTALRGLWRRIGTSQAASPLTRGPLERWLFGWEAAGTLAWRGLEAASRLFSPDQLNPFGHNPLRAVIQDALDLPALRDPAAPRVWVGVTEVETGQARLFTNEQITVDVLLASACLPFVFPTVIIDGVACWDGGYSGNPPLGPLLRPQPPSRLHLVRALPGRRVGVPRGPTEIFDRLHEIACQSALTAELAALPASVRLSTYDADDVLAGLPASVKIAADPDLLEHLFRTGRTVAEAGTSLAAAGG